MNSKIPCREIIEPADFPEISEPISINRMIAHHHDEWAGSGSVVHLYNSNTKNEKLSN